MTRVTTTLCLAFAVTWTTAVGAQQRTQSGQSARDITPTVTLLGCVESNAPNTFVLNVVEPPARVAGATVVSQRVQLMGSARSNLGTHVGHKVEVTGTMVPQGATRGRARQPVAEMRLNVSNLRMISAMCDPSASRPQTQPRSAAPAPQSPPEPQPQQEQPR